MGFRELARQLRLIDVPDARKWHQGAVPLCGGIAIFVAFSVIVVISSRADAFALMPGLSLILITGVLDDRFNLPALPRLAIQLFATCLMLGMTDMGAFDLGFVVERFEDVPSYTRILFAIGLMFVALAFVVGLINAVNMSDGVDGLAGGASAASFFWLSLIAFDAGEKGLSIQAQLLMGACLGFLVFNMRHPWRSKASLFLGDGGSTLLGGALAIMVLLLADETQSRAFPVLAWIVVVPVVDTLSLIVRRTVARRSPFSADRQHLHHLMMDAGLSPGQTAFGIVTLNFVTGAFAYTAIRLELPVWIMLLSFALPVLAHTFFVLRMTRWLDGLTGTSSIINVTQATKTNITLPGATP
ncbi:undecaprenyl/decaprenyl-phosphate alpha-N-acetylglucosaminyl 1-phosphate transferase [Ochrobactrum sp. CM-21-5]|nr:undecaprenyl/decaprenyl-phosphate alpha-N-acetylglucosaminyl 1-phosphate transferase [Ochrobactrum sp. CM-21-5]